MGVWWSCHENDVREISVRQGRRIDVQRLRVERLQVRARVLVVVDQKDVSLALVLPAISIVNLNKKM